MSAQPGYKAELSIGSPLTVICGITSAEISIEADTFDVSDFCSAPWRKQISGLSGYTLSLDGKFDLTQAQQLTLQAAIITNPGTEVQWKLVPVKGGASPANYSGSGFITSETLTFDVTAEQTVSFELAGNGAIVFTPPA